MHGRETRNTKKKIRLFETRVICPLSSLKQFEETNHTNEKKQNLSDSSPLVTQVIKKGKSLKNN